jgi:rhomboid protease GluP
MMQPLEITNAQKNKMEENVQPTKKHLVWIVILTLTVLVHLALFVANDYQEFHPEWMLQWGANYAPYTLTGESWRLLSSVFMHSSWLHLCMNMVMLMAIGEALERLVGSLRFFLAYILCGVGGSFLSAYWHGHHEVTKRGMLDLFAVSGIDPIVSVGASGALMGLVGYFAAEYLRRYSESPEYTNDLDGTAILQVIGLNIGLGFFMDNVDNAAHIGGLLTGLLVGFLLYVKQDKSVRSKLSESSVYVLTIFTLGLLAFYMAAKSGGSEELEQFRKQVDQELHEKTQTELE